MTEKGKCRSGLHEGQEKGSGDLSTQKDYGISPPGCAMSSCTKDKVTGNSEHRFTKGKLGLANLLACCDGVG